MAAIEVPDWYRTVALVGQDATGTPVVVLLDSTGAIISVMKGEYAGTLKNVQVDSQGRMIMIPTDPADVWGNAISMGNAELAAVLSSAKRYDRRGNIIFYSSFENGLGEVYTTAVGVSCGVRLNSSKALHGSYSAEIYLSADPTGWGEVAKWLSYLPSGRIGVEVAFTLNSKIDTVRVDGFYYTGTKLRRACIQYDVDNTKWQYLGSDGNFADLLSPASYRMDDDLFHQAKLVADYDAKKYIRALLDDEEIDMSAYAIRETDVVEAPNFWGAFFADDASDGACSIFVDHLVLTQNEPA